MRYALSWSALIVITDAGLSDWSSAKSMANSLRSMSNPVRICTALVTSNSNCDLPGQNVGMNELANTANLDLPLPDEAQPQGYFVCLAQADELAPLCESCISSDPHGIWTIFNTDCNSNGLLNACGDCPADAVITSNPSKVDVSDLLVVIDNWGVCAISYPCPGDLNCDGLVDVNDVLMVISMWGSTCGASGAGIPRTVQDCLNRFPLGSLELEKCLELVEYLQNQGN